MSPRPREEARLCAARSAAMRETVSAWPEAEEARERRADDARGSALTPKLSLCAREAWVTWESRVEACGLETVKRGRASGSGRDADAEREPGRERARGMEEVDRALRAEAGASSAAWGMSATSAASAVMVRPLWRRRDDEAVSGKPASCGVSVCVCASGSGGSSEAEDTRLRGSWRAREEAVGLNKVELARERFGGRSEENLDALLNAVVTISSGSLVKDEGSVGSSNNDVSRVLSSPTISPFSKQKVTLGVVAVVRPGLLGSPLEDIVKRHRWRAWRTKQEGE
jgi:hypothetical protein